MFKPSIFRRRRRQLVVFASRNYLSAAVCFFLLMVGIGAIPGEATKLSAVVDDRVLHFCAYMLLSCLIYAGLAGNVHHRALGTFALILILGLLDEALQSLMPYRVSDLGDLGYDILAAAASVLLMSLSSAFRHKRRIARIYDALRATPIE